MITNQDLMQLGYLLNFGAPLMKDGLYRVVNDYRPTSESRLRIHQTGPVESAHE